MWIRLILATLFAFAAIALMGVILLQRGRGVGLSGAFGGAGGHTAFGAKTGDALTWFTIIGAIVVLTGAVILNYVFVPLNPLGAPAAPPPGALPPIPPSGTGAPTAPGGTSEGAPLSPSETPPGAPEPTRDTAPPGGGDTPFDAALRWGSASLPGPARHDLFGAELG